MYVLQVQYLQNIYFICDDRYILLALRVMRTVILSIWILTVLLQLARTKTSFFDDHLHFSVLSQAHIQYTYYVSTDFCGILRESLDHYIYIYSRLCVCNICNDRGQGWTRIQSYIYNTGVEHRMAVVCAYMDIQVRLQLE